MADSKEKGVNVRELDEAFDRHRQNVEKTKLEYDAAYERLPGNLSASLLEPFAKILLEQESIVLDTETCMKSIQQKMRKELMEPWDNAWKEHVANNIAKLEMLKEHFKEFEGQDWMVHAKNVDERTLPLRIEFKRKRLHWLRKLVERQGQEIEKLTEETQQRRLLIQRITEEGLMLSNHMSNINTKEIKKQLKDEFNELLFYPDWSTRNGEDTAG